MHRYAIGALLCVVMATPRIAQSQVRIGGGLGYEFDLTEKWLHVAADARFTLPTKHMEFNPRILYNPGDGYSVLQADANVVFNLDLERSKRVTPYAGAGVLLQRISVDAFGTSTPATSETKVGLNLLAGARVNTEGPISPFATMSYAVVREQGNSMILLLGAHWVLGR